jgi:hypothetical protein
MRICHRAMTIDGEVMSNDNGTTTVRKNSDCRVLAMKLIIIAIEFSLDTKYRNRGFQTSCHGDQKKKKLQHFLFFNNKMIVYLLLLLLLRINAQSLLIDDYAQVGKVVASTYGDFTVGWNFKSDNIEFLMSVKVNFFRNCLKSFLSYRSIVARID